MFRVKARLTANRPTTTTISSTPSIPSGAELYPRCSSTTGPATRCDRSLAKPIWPCSKKPFASSCSVSRGFGETLVERRGSRRDAALCRVVRIRQLLQKIPHNTLSDFRWYYLAAQHVLHGESPYLSSGYIYSPFLACLLAPLASLNYVPAFWVWFLASHACLLWAAWLIWRYLGSDRLAGCAVALVWALGAAGSRRKSCVGANRPRIDASAGGGIYSAGARAGSMRRSGIRSQSDPRRTVRDFCAAP